MLFDAGDGNCLYRALMVRIVEAACTSQNTRFLADRLSVLHQELPQWMATPTIDYGFQLLMVGPLAYPISHHPSSLCLESAQGFVGTASAA